MNLEDNLEDQEVIFDGEESEQVNDQEEQEEQEDNREDNQSDESDDKVEEKVEEKVEPSKPVETPQLTQPVEDPGDFTPNDYAFDIQLADGKTIRIEKPEDIHNVPADVDFGSPVNLMEAQANYVKMINGIENDKKQYEEKKAEYDRHQESAKEQEQRVNTWAKELEYLESQGKLSKITAEENEKNWSDPESQKSPAIKERVEIFNFMREENKVRDQYGLPKVTSLLEAKTLMDQKSAESQDSDQKNREATIRKAKGAMVSGGQPSSQPDLPDDIIAGPGGSIWDL
jgi:hypothetical protein